MYKKLISDKSTFFCFTPIVSLSTFIIELLLAIYVLFRYKITKFNLVSVVLISMLGIFQLSSFMLCETNNLLLWGRIGAASITLLPVLGLHLITYLTRKSRWVTLGYVIGIIYILMIFFVPALSIDTRCTGKFVILLPQTIYQKMYMYYYLGFLLIGIEMMIRSLIIQKRNKQKILWMLIAYLAFIIPTILVFIFISITLAAVPSIMCGFAILLALILVLKEIPKSNKVINAKIQKSKS